MDKIAPAFTFIARLGGHDMTCSLTWTSDKAIVSKLGHWPQLACRVRLA
jgi:hypothetical protein